MSDLIGTIRRHSFTGGYETWVLIADRHTDNDGNDIFSSQWVCADANDPGFCGLDAVPPQLEDCPIVGAIPGSPAARGEES